MKIQIQRIATGTQPNVHTCAHNEFASVPRLDLSIKFCAQRIRIGPPTGFEQFGIRVCHMHNVHAHLHRLLGLLIYIRGASEHRWNSNACIYICMHDQSASGMRMRMRDTPETVGTFRSPMQISRSKGGCLCHNYFQQTRACTLRRVLFT